MKPTSPIEKLTTYLVGAGSMAIIAWAIVAFVRAEGIEFNLTTSGFVVAFLILNWVRRHKKT